MDWNSDLQYCSNNDIALAEIYKSKNDWLNVQCWLFLIDSVLYFYKQQHDESIRYYKMQNWLCEYD